MRGLQGLHQLLDRASPLLEGSTFFSERPVATEQIARFHNPEKHSENFLSPENLECYIYFSYHKIKEILDPTTVYVSNNTPRAVVHQLRLQALS